MKNKSRKGGPAIVCHVGYGPTERNTEDGTQNSMYGIAFVPCTMQALCFCRITEGSNPNPGADSQ